MRSPIHRFDAGSPGARLVLIGEAFGGHEVGAGQPFVGPAGNLLDRWWRGVGLARDDFYITNAVADGTQPPNIDRIPQAEMERHFDALHERLAQLEDPWLIVPVGNYALYALTGKGKVSFHKKDGRNERPGILSHRGSIMEYVDRRGRTIKVIPGIHPAACFQDPGLEQVCTRYDWPRIAHDARFRERRLLEREHFIKPTLDDLRAYVADVLEHGQHLTIDIETPMEVKWRTVTRTLKNGKPGKPRKVREDAVPYIGCIGFATSPRFSFTIPTTLAYWGSVEALAEAWALIDRLLQSPLPKNFQNGMFDTYHLAWEGHPVARWLWDTRWMHRSVDPSLPHNLAFLTSIHTRQPYYKDECKDPEEIQKYASNSENLWTYNGIDCCVQSEVAFGPRDEACEAPLLERLRREGRMAYYRENHAEQFDALLAMALQGIPTDVESAHEQLATLEAECSDLATQLATTCGMPLIAKTGLSPLAARYYLYGAKGLPEKSREKWIEKTLAKHPDAKTLNLPLQYAKRGKREAPTVSVNEVTVIKLARRFPDKLRDVAPLILAHRRKSQMKQFVDLKVDGDKKLRCMFSWVKNGRLATQENPRKTGRNLQNIDRELRAVYVPEEG